MARRAERSCTSRRRQTMYVEPSVTGVFASGGAGRDRCLLETTAPAVALFLFFDRTRLRPDLAPKPDRRKLVCSVPPVLDSTVDQVAECVRDWSFSEAAQL